MERLGYKTKLFDTHMVGYNFAWDVTPSIATTFSAKGRGQKILLPKIFSAPTRLP